ncbi:MAG: Gfo/Idh/MocA family oxidoreductase, partial [Pseudomonadota bacterium]
TRHGNHAELVSSALAAGKNVFVEKPLAINQQQLDQVRAALDASNNENGAPQLMIGFNRRFSSLIKDIKQALNSVQNPIAMVMTVNAGYIPGNHWTQSKDEGGGRLIGEACHFIDLLRFLAGHAITTSSAQLMQSECSDTATINLTFANGTIGTVHYFSNGHKDISKERLEVYADGKVIQMDNFRSLKATGWKNLKSRKLSKQDKGHAEEIRQFIAGLVNGQPAPIPLDELIEVSQHSLNISPWS